MKKMNLLFVSLLTFLMFSCSNETPTEDVGTDTVEEVLEEAEIEVSGGELPNFENKELAAFTQEFNVFFNKSMALLKAVDMEGLAALDEESKALQIKGEKIKDQVSEVDKALLEEYLKGRAGEMLSASGLDKLGEKMKEEMNNAEN